MAARALDAVPERTYNLGADAARAAAEGDLDAFRGVLNQVDGFADLERIFQLTHARAALALARPDPPNARNALERVQDLARQMEASGDEQQDAYVEREFGWDDNAASRRAAYYLRHLAQEFGKQNIVDFIANNA